MQNGFKNIPSPSSLIGFEASARHLSFTKAARELNLSQAAISKQITNLEGRLGRRLFIRKHRSLILTKEGQVLYEGVRSGLRHIQNAVNWISTSSTTHSITISATTAFAQLWLLPRLAKFKQENPKINLRLLTSDDNFMEADEQVDIAIKYGDNTWKNVATTHLVSCDLMPVCSPAFQQEYRLTQASDLTRVPLLDLDENHWQWIHWHSWLLHSNFETNREHINIEFNNIPMLYRAAEEGQGVALGWSLLIQDLLQDGRLIPLFDQKISLSKPWGYYLIESLQKELSPEAHRAKEWIIRETAKVHSKSFCI